MKLVRSDRILLIELTVTVTGTDLEGFLSPTLFLTPIVIAKNLGILLFAHCILSQYPIVLRPQSKTPWHL
jgi:hypothetical protein